MHELKTTGNTNLNSLGFSLLSRWRWTLLFSCLVLCVLAFFLPFFVVCYPMATGHNLIFPPRTMRLLSVILLIQSSLQSAIGESAIGVTIQGILTCNLYANQDRKSVV
jgi:hypothetical protein